MLSCKVNKQISCSKSSSCVKVTCLLANAYASLFFATTFVALDAGLCYTIPSVAEYCCFAAWSMKMSKQDAEKRRPTAGCVHNFGDVKTVTAAAATGPYYIASATDSVSSRDVRHIVGVNRATPTHSRSWWSILIKNFGHHLTSTVPVSQVGETRKVKDNANYAIRKP